MPPTNQILQARGILPKLYCIDSSISIIHHAELLTTYHETRQAQNTYELITQLKVDLKVF
jgi:hypothetical protein